MKPRLKINTRIIRDLQERFGISNLLAPTPEDATKLANLDLLNAAYYEGSRSWDTPPSKDDIEEIDLPDLVEAFKIALSGEKSGNG